MEYSQRLGLINIEDARAILGWSPGQLSGYQIRLVNPEQAPALTYELSAQLVNSGLLGQFQVYDWTMTSGPFFEAVALQKQMMFVILSLLGAGCCSRGSVGDNTDFG